MTDLDIAFGGGFNQIFITSKPAMDDSVESMIFSAKVRDLATHHGLQISTVAWEDTGRTKGSCFGPNISDMTLCVGGRSMPIIRKPNFSDLTSDQDIGAYTVNVGNEKGSALRSISLKDYLQNIESYSDIKVRGSLIAARDTHVLTSAQACVLPLEHGKVEFGVRLYNYQSNSEPAVLVVVASAQGTSAHVVLGRDNILKFNKGGLAAEFVAERLRDDRERRGVAVSGAMTAEEKVRNVLMIFQIPLKVKETTRGSSTYSTYLNAVPACMYFDSAPAAGCASSSLRLGGVSKSMQRGMDHAMVSTSEGRGSFPSLARWTIERDERMPIRCTLQYYHVSDTADVTSSDMAEIASEVTRHKPVGSLVVEETRRPTEHSAPAPTFIEGVAKLFSFL